MKKIFIDFEMNPIDNTYEKEREICNYEIIEIGAVMLDESNTHLSEFTTYIKPEYSEVITSRITELTGITTEMVFYAENFESALGRFLEWCGDVNDIETVYSWSDNDYRQLKGEIKLKNIEAGVKINSLLDKWCDFQKLFSGQVGLKKPMSLQNAIEAVGREFAGRAHDALTDAVNTAELFVVSRDDEETKKMIELLKKTRKPQASLQTALGDIIDFKSMGIE